MMSEAIPRLIVAHGGKAHRDDIIAIALAVANLSTNTTSDKITVVRREPKEEELLNPEITVLDVGRQYQPELNNFDHHQLEDSIDTAFSLYAKHIGLDLSVFKWFLYSCIFDNKGPNAAAELVHLDKIPIETSSPIESALLNIIGSYKGTSLPAHIVAILKDMGESIINTAKQLIQARENLESTTQELRIDGLRIVIYNTHETLGTHDYWERHNRQEDPIVASISPIMNRDTGEKGEGYSLYRYNDHPNVNFCKLEGNPDIAFIHKSGFLASTKPVSLGKALSLLCEAFTGYYKQGGTS